MKPAILKELPLDSIPENININNLLSDIISANSALAKLDGALLTLKNPGILLSPLLHKEAVSSSTIEGTRASLNEVLEYEAIKNNSEKNEKNQDIKEILNYKKAIVRGMTLLKQKPLSENLIKELHGILLDSVRGEGKAPGNFRKGLVYIGKPNSSIDEASFIPPSPENITSLFSNWERFLNMNNSLDHLVKIGIAHYQFEAIHPFMDGNGRIGRLIIPLYLYQNDLLSYPVLYVSSYLEKYRGQYMDLLHNIDGSEKSWEAWLKFFLIGVKIQAEEAKNKVQIILALKEKHVQEITKQVRSSYANEFIEFIYSHPIFTYQNVLEYSQIKTPQTVYNLIKKFESIDIISPTSETKRNKIYTFNALLKIINN